MGGAASGTEPSEDTGPKLRPETSARGAAPGQMLGPVMGVGVFRPTIGMMGGDSAKKVEVDALHGFRPG